MIACDFVLCFVWLSNSFVLRLNKLWECCSEKTLPSRRVSTFCSSKGIRIDVHVLSIAWSVEDHSMNIQVLKEGLIEHEASDTGGVPR